MSKKLVQGDFQTPLALASKVWEQIAERDYQLIVEPTVGAGNFLQAAPQWAQEIDWAGYDLQSSYVRRSKKVAATLGVKAKILKKDVFTLTEKDFSVAGQDVLVVGNPPWVTTAALATLGSTNAPLRQSTELSKGLAAMTGKSNFDISEAVLLTLLRALQSAASVDCFLLLKRSVAIRLSQILLQKEGYSQLIFAPIDAERYFSANVDAGLFSLRYQPQQKQSKQNLLIRKQIGGGRGTKAGYVNERFVLDLGSYKSLAFLESTGKADTLQWRQGIKHDAASILELYLIDQKLVNGLGESVNIEESLLCPFYKSSDVANAREASRVFPFYQRSLSSPDLSDYPLLKKYLKKHAASFAARKSSIYSGKHPYALFGVGPYTALPYKVAVSGLHKQLQFTLLRPKKGQPPLTDDATYFLSFKKLSEAKAAQQYLQLEAVQKFLHSLSNPLAKRVWTKELLSRLWLPPLTTELHQLEGLSYSEQVQYLKTLRA